MDEARAFLQDKFEKALNSMGGLTQSQLSALRRKPSLLPEILCAAIDGGFQQVSLIKDKANQSSYRAPRSADEQVEILCSLFGFDPAPAKGCLEVVSNELPYSAEGLLVIPSVRGMQRVCGMDEETFNSDHLMAAFGQKIMDLLRDRRPCSSFNPIRCAPSTEAYRKRTSEALKILDDTQPGDLWIIGAQLGANKHPSMQANEFDLPAYALLCALLMHPNRLVTQKDSELNGHTYMLGILNGELRGMNSGYGHASGFLL